MRTVRGGISFGGLIRAAGVGAYLGAAVARLLAVLTGQAFAAGSPWPDGAPVLALLGAAGRLASCSTNPRPDGTKIVSAASGEA